MDEERGTLNRKTVAILLLFTVHRSAFLVHSLKMARGWESKAVADQMEEADGRAQSRAAVHFAASPDERARRERLESLRLSRARTLEQLERATNNAYRGMLQRTLRALEKEIEELKLVDQRETK